MTSAPLQSEGAEQEPTTPPAADQDAVEAVPIIVPKKREASRRRRRQPFRGVSRLDAFILTVNLALLLVLVAGIIFTDRSRLRLIDARKEALAIQGEMIAGAIAETAVLEDVVANKMIDGVETPIPLISQSEAESIIRRLVLPTKSRTRLYDYNGMLIADSKALVSSLQIDRFDLAPPGEQRTLDRWWDRAVDWMMSFYPKPDLKPYVEAPPDKGPETYSELALALTGQPSAADRLSTDDGLIVSVAVPVQRLKANVGAVLLTTEGDDIEAIVRQDNEAVLRITVMSLVVSLFLSGVLARSIARPLRRLSQAAEEAATGPAGKRVDIPDMSKRHDEIGDLSSSFRHMMEALYARIEAIERFAADVSHELKNPLTSIRSAVDTLNLVKKPEQRERLLEVIRDDVQRMDRLITDIASASRLDAELARGETDEIVVPEMLGALVDAAMATRKSGQPLVEIRSVLDEWEPEQLRVQGFESRLAQVFTNLISNARSFSPPEKAITLTISVVDEDGHKVRVFVDDCGPGIPEENLETIFDRFYTSRPGLEFGKNSGLGLSISRQIVIAHGGQIWAENRPAGGARFTVTLPMMPLDAR